MVDDFDNNGLELDVLMASLRMDGKQSEKMLDLLAQKLSSALPENVEVKRGGWLLSKEKPVEQILVRFDDFHYQLSKEKHGPLQALQLKVVRGVVLKTVDISYDQWIAQVAEQLSALASRNAQARDAINKMV